MNLYIVGLSVVAGALYRLGGAGKRGDWLDWARHTKVRDLGVPLCVTLALLPGNWVGLLVSFLLLFGALTLGYGGSGEPPEDQSHLYRVFKHGVFFVVGALFGVALIPYAIAHSGVWVGVWARTAALSIIVGLLPYVPAVGPWDKDIVEEFSRGAAIVATLALLSIGQ